jgi:glycosyltransferase involved in cell wall biosynthesis
MRLCIATSSYPSKDGNPFAGVFARDFAKELAYRGNEVSVFTQDTGYSPLQDDGIEVITFPWPGKATPLSTLKLYHPFDLLKIFILLQKGTSRLAQHCLREKVDLVLALWALPAGHWAMSVQRRLGIPFAAWSLGSDIWIYGRIPILKLWVRKILRQSRYCFADGFTLLDEIRALSGRPCSFLPTTRILPKEGVPRLPFDPHKIHYFFIGRYHPNKGPDLLLEAIHQIEPETLLNLRFHFYGIGPLEGDLRRKVLEYGLQDSVTIHGPVDPYEMAGILQQGHHLIIPSRIESIPVVLSDALQLDCNLIVTDVGDMGSLVRSHQAGIVVDRDSPVGLKEAILDQCNRKRDEFKEGRQKLYGLFDLKKSVDIFLRTIESHSPVEGSPLGNRVR